MPSLLGALAYSFTWRTMVLSLFLALCIGASFVDAQLYDASVMLSYADKSSVQSCSSTACGPCPSVDQATAQEIAAFLAILPAAFATIETMIQFFAFGFSIRLIKSVVVVDHEQDKIHDSLFNSAVMGLSLASFVLGLGLFVPRRFSTNLFEY
jgi:hypothetical protein